MASKEALSLAPTRLDDSDVEVDENLLTSSDNESEDDEAKQSNIRKVLDILDKSTKRKKQQRIEPSLNISEYHLSANADDDKVDVNDLLGSLQKDGGYGNLKKRLESMERNTSTLDVPLHKGEADRIQRTIAYEETSKEVGKWQPIVKKNREAEHLSFPMNAYKEPAITTKTLAVNFKPRTPLEEEIAAVLKGSSHMMERPNKELTEEEEKALLAMSVEEAKERRHELQRLRALQSYYEEKCRRAKKIKSKKYHRIKKKGEKRAASKDLEELEKSDPEKALEQLEKLDRERAKERLSLKHRTTSKWAKNLLIRGQKNPQAKKALQEQLELSRQLTEKQRLETDSEEEEQQQEEENRLGDEEADTSHGFGSLVTDTDNPWNVDKTSTPVLLGEESEQTEDLSGFKRAQPVKNTETTDINDSLDENSENSDIEKQDDDFEITLAKTEKQSTKSSKKKRRKKTLNKEEPEERSNKNKGKSKSEKEKSKNKKKTNIQEDEEETYEGDAVTIETGNHDSEITIEPTIPKLSFPAELPTRKKPRSASVIVDPKKILPYMDTDDNHHHDDAGQLMTIQQAFANDDVIEEFVREKDETVEASKGKDLDLTLPGWGDWGGPGVQVSEKKKKKFIKKAKEQPTRQDKDLAHVIINENVNKKFVKMQVAAIPHPYQNTSQFEHSIRNPVGQHWNTAASVKQLTQPRVQTLMGTIIEPIKPTKDLKRPNKDKVDSKRKKMKKRSKNDGSESLNIYS